ncbi:tetratricopeptide repeat protein [Ornithinimicrobium cryptoxanthini]|uniref:Tetratricopeptide repeat protein n=1 Tax=Ornithinimicrobium cryptoxanthini TaxID=2934161 RepID=A0ABY4YE26_9MICO|nr:tetratricopeptide repeat protein [Ornithinimicrobium cryptoxanthini]USQ74894.1 tetratricopeptide repeat protein [Ornithinimicrobium cryptoxanthini]
MTEVSTVQVTEVRLLEGPNLYFARPSVKVSLSLPGYQALDGTTAAELAEKVGLRRAVPGKPHTEQRQRFLSRLAGTLLRRIAAGVPSRVGVRGRVGTALDAVIVAFPWRHRGRAVALGEALGPVLQGLLDGEDADELLASAAQLVRSAEDQTAPTQMRPRIPVASITGTNGKTSTTRLLAHMGMTAGQRCGWSSTEGVFIQGELIQPGDYSGPSGGRMVLQDKSVQLGLLETARGGLLLKGMGVSHNDVSIVTNVTADHLGMQGIDTVDQLAEVKAIITRVTRKDGWVVLNGDDPRVRAMANDASGRIWMFSLHPDSPALRETVDRGGRGMTVLEGDIVILRRGADPDRLIRILDVPMTLSGLSEHNIANALAATAGALGLGLSRDAVVEGLRTFTPDLEHNPGRMNVWTVPLPSGGKATMIIDAAHNEAGLEALLNVAEGLRPPGDRVHLGLGGVGDRTDEILIGLGEIAGRRVDRVHIVHKGHYLRGRTTEDLEAQFVQGLANVGAVATGSSDNEVDGLATMVEHMADGDVGALMVHADRADVVEWLRAHGAHQDTARQIRRKVVAARGEHELEAVLAAIQEQPPAERVEAARNLLDQTPDDPRLVFEVAAALDAAGQTQQAMARYAEALGARLREPHRFRAQVALASGLRALGRQDEAEQLVNEVAVQREDSAAVVALQSLLDVDAGRAGTGVARLIDYLMTHATSTDDAPQRDALRALAEEMRATQPAS